MHLTLIVPDLIWQRPALLGEAPDLPGAGALLSACTSVARWNETIDALLCARMGVDTQEGEWPAAPLLAAYDGIDTTQGHWLCADPVYLSAEADTVMLNSALQATHGELRGLFDTLNLHFAQEDIRFVVPGADRAGAGGYLRSPRAVRGLARSPRAAAGRSILPFMPRQATDTPVGRWLNDIQMLLHEHPVNRAREALGLAPVNSVWLWGAGARPSLDPAPFDGVWGEDRLLAALAFAHRLPCRRLPETAVQLLEDADAQSALVLLAAPAPDSAEAAAAWAALDACWLVPLARALERGTIAGMDLAFGGQFDDGSGWRIARLRPWRIAAAWRRMLPARRRFATQVERLRTC